MATSGKSINLCWERGTKPSSYLTGLLGFSSEDEESGKSEKPQTKLVVGPIAVVSSVFSQLPHLSHGSLRWFYVLFCALWVFSQHVCRFADSWDIVLIIVGMVMTSSTGR